MNPGTAPGIYEHQSLQEKDRRVLRDPSGDEPRYNCKQRSAGQENVRSREVLPLHKLDSCIGFIALGDLISRVWAKIILKATSKKEANLPLTLSDGSYVGRRRRAISRSS